MRMTPGLSLGAPGIYNYPEPTPKVMGSARMDVCAFVGVSPRGPVRLPEEPENGATLDYLLQPDSPKRRSVAVAVESWNEYLANFGGFEGPGRLPYAVAAFFEQGGRRAYVVRIVHEYATTDKSTAKEIDKNNSGVAEGILHGAVSSTGRPIILRARNEGSWGNNLQASLGFSASPITLLPGTTAAELVIDEANILAMGSLLRLSWAATAKEPAKKVLRFVSFVRRKGEEDSGLATLRVTLETAVSAVPDAAELIEGIFTTTDRAGLSEEWQGVGLSSLHPRWLGAVLYRESKLVYPHKNWVSGNIIPKSPELVPFAPCFQSASTAANFSEGYDRYSDIKFDDFFDKSWTVNDTDPGDGIQAVSHLADLSTLVVPDLYVPEPLPEQKDIRDFQSFAGSSFAPCVDVDCDMEKMNKKDPALKGLHLDPNLPDDLETITTLQEKLAGFVESLQNFVVLLDVPPGLSREKILRWRARFQSSYLAAYYPWLRTARIKDNRNKLILLNPSAVAAGIIAAQETRFGVPHGPANVIAEGVVKVDEAISPVRHAEFHPRGINVYLQEKDGVWLSAGRTLSRDKRYRQLSVRRLMLMLKRTLLQEMQWAVFEPNSPDLWREVRLMLGNYLRRLFMQGAFHGKSEEQAFFVHCDGQLNNRREIDAGRMLCEVGVAPAEPLEFLVVRITRDGDGTLTVES
ncbi:phage tail sheath C-terminal domain-containing protein [Desulfogranum marinum]|uniref:phage tail sheath family protein n=1 Tax=Desulfogranum marinum TaxID=453220 RepID=UPI0029C7432A|nr:phage tail sheath C-terminal domain-containing protein [Desulfogranum marinum]